MFSKLPLELREEIICKLVDKFSFVDIYKTLGKQIKYCNQIQDLYKKDTWDTVVKQIATSDDKQLIQNFAKDFKDQVSWNKIFTKEIK